MFRWSPAHPLLEAVRKSKRIFITHGVGGFPLLAERGDDVLEEKQMDRHLVFVLVRNLWHPGEKAGAVVLGIEFVAVIGEIQHEGWIRDDAVEFFREHALEAEAQCL